METRELSKSSLLYFDTILLSLDTIFKAYAYSNCLGWTGLIYLFMLSVLCSITIYRSCRVFSARRTYRDIIICVYKWSLDTIFATLKSLGMNGVVWVIKACVCSDHLGWTVYISRLCRVFSVRRTYRDIKFKTYFK